jgi:hypothetical protein
MRDHEKLNESEESLLDNEHVPSRRRETYIGRHRLWVIALTCTNALLFVGSAILFATNKYSVNNSWLRETSYYCKA